MMTEKEIAHETFEHYKTHPYGYSKQGGCIYSSGDGQKKCAVGRAIDSQKLKEITGYDLVEIQHVLELEFESDVLGLRDYLETLGHTLDDVLLPKYQGQSLQLWQNLQRWHDSMATSAVDPDACKDVEKRYSYRR